MPTCMRFMPHVLPIMPVSCDTRRHPSGPFHKQPVRGASAFALFRFGEVIPKAPLLDKQLPGAVIFDRVFLSWDCRRASRILKVVIEFSPKGGS